MANYSKKQKIALDAMMKEEVYKCALNLLTDSDTGALSLEMLAAEIGVSRATLYNYFKDRDAILEFVEERTFSPVLEKLRVIADANDTPTEKLKAFIGETVRSEAELGKILIAVSREHQVGRRRLTGEANENGGRAAEYTNILAKLIKDGIESGDLADQPITLVTDLIVGMLRAVTMRMVTSNQVLNPEEVLPVVLQTVFQGLRKTA